MIRWLVNIFRRRPKDLGTLGEEFAAKYLKKQGMKIIAKNRRFKRGEIDIIAIDGEWLVFVEVRTRTSETFIRPEESIRHHKRRLSWRTVRAITCRLWWRIDASGRMKVSDVRVRTSTKTSQ